MARFRTAFRKLVPSWLSTGDGELVLYSLGVVLDAFADSMRQALYARFPEHAPEDALPYLGRDRKIVRGINEPRERYAARLLRWLDDHQVRGNPYALMGQLRAYCQADVKLRTVDNRGNWFTIDRDGTRSVLIDEGNWDWDGADPSQWSRFWVFIYPTEEGDPWERDGTWGDGSVWSTDPELGTWGSTATHEEVATVQSIVREWQPDGTRCMRIIIVFEYEAGDPFDPSGTSPPLPDGTWANWSKNVGGVQVPARDERAIYWRGTAA